MDRGAYTRRGDGAKLDYEDLQPTKLRQSNTILTRVQILYFHWNGISSRDFDVGRVPAVKCPGTCMLALQLQHRQQVEQCQCGEAPGCRMQASATRSGLPATSFPSNGFTQRGWQLLGEAVLWLYYISLLETVSDGNVARREIRAFKSALGEKFAPRA